MSSLDEGWFRLITNILIQSRDLPMIARWYQCGTMTSQMLACASFSAVCLTVFPLTFEFRPRTFTIGFLGKKLYYIRAYDFRVQFSFNQASEAHLLTSKVLAQPETIQVTFKSWRWFGFLCKKEAKTLLYQGDHLTILFLFILFFFFAKRRFSRIFSRRRKERGDLETLKFFSLFFFAVLFFITAVEDMIPLFFKLAVETLEGMILILH